MTLIDWLNNRWLLPHEIHQQEVEALLALADQDLADCAISQLSLDRRLESASAQSRFNSSWEETMHRSWLAALVFIVACSSGPEESGLNTVFLQFSTLPGQSEVAAVRARGGAESVTVIPIAHAISLRTANSASDYERLPGVTRSVSLGAPDDPVRSIFITVVSTPSLEDTTFIRSVGAEQVGIIQPGTIAAVMRLSAVVRIGENPRFLEVVVGLDDNVPQ